MISHNCTFALDTAIAPKSASLPFHKKLETTSAAITEGMLYMFHAECEQKAVALNICSFVTLPLHKITLAIAADSGDSCGSAKIAYFCLL